MITQEWMRDLRDDIVEAVEACPYRGSIKERLDKLFDDHQSLYRRCWNRPAFNERRNDELLAAYDEACR